MELPVLRGRVRYLAGVDGPGESKIAYFEITVGVDEEVGRLEVSVDNVGAVHVLERLKQLPDKKLEVVVGEALSAADYLVEVCGRLKHERGSEGRGGENGERRAGGMCRTLARKGKQESS